MNMSVPFSVAEQQALYEVPQPAQSDNERGDIWLPDFLLTAPSTPYASSSIVYERLSIVNRALIHSKALDGSVQTRLFHRLTSCALVHSELRRAACVYPIVFTDESSSIPVALFSFQEKVNPFAAGGALASLAYVPAAVRQYPFVAMTLSSDDDMVLGVDANALSDSASDASLEQNFFEADGRSKAMFDQVAEFCIAFQHEAATTVRMMQCLNDLNVLCTKRILAKSSGGRRAEIGHFKVVDESRWANLDPSVRLDLANERILDLVLAHLKSLKCIGMLGGELMDVEPA